MSVKFQHDLADVFVHCFPYKLNIVNACQIQAIRNIMVYISKVLLSFGNSMPMHRFHLHFSSAIWHVQDDIHLFYPKPLSVS